MAMFPVRYKRVGRGLFRKDGVEKQDAATVHLYCRIAVICFWKTLWKKGDWERLTWTMLFAPARAPTAVFSRNNFKLVKNFKTSAYPVCLIASVTGLSYTSVRPLGKLHELEIGRWCMACVSNCYRVGTLW